MQTKPRKLKVLNVNPSKTSSLPGWPDKMTATVSLIRKWDFKNWGEGPRNFSLNVFYRWIPIKIENVSKWIAN